ncbi:hypothetical protein HU200_060077 [Digitaria exilis]|uniref:sterol 22-desaturase n=1 Tax=Digitaria exilis TaxID=1010633 RepID=A0A835AFD1_9POAL|nr:hypothetical protein HU200_060077 [Digitaria exilis]
MAAESLSSLLDIHAAAPFLVAALLALYILSEQLSYQRKKGTLPGPPLVVPFVGSVTHLIRDQTGFWDAQAARARDSGVGLAADSLAGRFILFVRDTELSHRVFANVRPDAFQLIAHPWGDKIFGDHNIIYKFGDDHKHLRRRISPFFNPRALSTNTLLHQRVILAHLRKWLHHAAHGAAIPLRVPCREMNLDVSQALFVGPYLDETAKGSMRRDYNLFNVGLMAMPLDLPGFAFRRARRAARRLARALAECARKSKARVRAGGTQPECLVDFWMEETVREIDEAAAAGLPRPPHSSDEEIGGFLLDILFAAQDASTSSLVWAVAVLGSHPDVLGRVRAEVAELWSPESGEPITPEQVNQMRYTHCVAREVIRYRPPAAMVPHVAREAFRLTDRYTVPKGAVVFPSLYESSMQGFSEPEAFDPERFFSEARREDVACRRNLLAFGAGAHQCVGKRYAMNHLVLFVALLVSVVDFRRDRTEGCDDLVYMPTIMPKDGCATFLRQRCNKVPSF